ncbi:MAG TPA: flagellar brake protein [Nitrosomonas sp.]|nr:flagellar brake protein [Nitrosomonas sp.]
MNINQDYLIDSQNEVTHILRTFLEQQTKVLLYLIGENISPVPTTVLNINPSQDELIVGYYPEAYFNQRAQLAERLVCVATHNGIRVEFESFSIGKTWFDGGAAYRLDFPKVISRVQRREYFRMSPLMKQQPKCAILDKDQQVIGFTILDISCGGMSIKHDRPNIKNFEVGEIYPDCSIELASPIGVIKTPIRIRNISEMPSKSNQIYTRYGCEFIDLPSKTRMMIQRYIIKLEQDSRSKDWM